MEAARPFAAGNFRMEDVGESPGLTGVSPCH